MAEPRTCPRHPDVETRLRCSACEEPICPNCAHEAAVGYQCPECARRDADDEGAAAGTGPGSLRRLAGGARRATASRGPQPDGASSELPVVVGVRATLVGLVAAAAAGLLIGPVLAQGAFFLISAGVLGWLVARAVFWASEERVTPYLRAVALVCAGVMVAIGHASASGPDGVRELAVIAYPAALYGGWIVVRQR